MSLYKDLIEAGVAVYSRESDIHFHSNEKTRAILARYPVEESNATHFKCQLSGHPMIEVPFGYEPYWERVAGKGHYLDATSDDDIRANVLLARQQGRQNAELYWLDVLRERGCPAI